MNDRLLRLYHTLPSPLRSTAAGIRGWQLRSWRYGANFERLVQEAREREGWSADRWRRLQEERLSVILSRAATRVPYYREQWGARRRRGDRASWEYLENWPILEKEAVRRNAAAFVADDRNRRWMLRESTSGTTGKPLALWFSRETVRAWYALFEARWRRWNGVSRDDRWAMLGGQLVVPVTRRRPPFWVWNPALNQLYMSAYHLAPALMPAYFDAMIHYRVRYLLGYTSALYTLAAEALRLDRRDLKMRVVLTSAEPLTDYQRRTISAAFQCPVRETYGMAEIVAAASECQSGRLHLWPEAAWFEISGDRGSSGQLIPGELVSTGLLNDDMPLVRYRTGDCVQTEDSDGPCSCGRLLPCIGSVLGRSRDVLTTSDGRRVFSPSFAAVFYGIPIREGQIVQEAHTRIRVRYVAAPGFTRHVERTIRERLCQRLGEVAVVFEPLEAIPRGPNGKFRGVICSIHAAGPGREPSMPRGNASAG